MPTPSPNERNQPQADTLKRRFSVGLSTQAPSEPTKRLERIRWAEAQGYPSVWITDGGGHMDAITVAAAAAAVTRRIRLALSIVPVYTRPAAVLATSAMTLSYLAPGRVIFGLGASSETMVDSWYGQPFHKPRTRVEETVTLLKAIFAGQKTDFQGSTLRSRGFRLALPMAAKMPIYLAALRPKMLETAGEHADGVILNLVPRRALPRVLECIDRGAKRSGRRVEDLEIAQLIHTVVTKNIAQAEQHARSMMTSYYSTQVYNAHLAWLGYQREAEAISEGFRLRNRKQTTEAISENTLHEFTILGDADTCRQRIRSYWEDGIDVPIIAANTPNHDEFIRTLEAFTPQALENTERAAS